MQHHGGLSSSLFFKQRGKIMEINLGIVANSMQYIIRLFRIFKRDKKTNIKRMVKAREYSIQIYNTSKKELMKCYWNRKTLTKNISALGDRVTRVETRLDNVVSDFKDCKNHNCK